MALGYRKHGAMAWRSPLASTLYLLLFFGTGVIGCGRLLESSVATMAFHVNASERHRKKLVIVILTSDSTCLSLLIRERSQYQAGLLLYIIYPPKMINLSIPSENTDPWRHSGTSPPAACVPPYQVSDCSDLGANTNDSVGFLTRELACRMTSWLENLDAVEA